MSGLVSGSCPVHFWFVSGSYLVLVRFVSRFISGSCLGRIILVSGFLSGSSMVHIYLISI